MDFEEAKNNALGLLLLFLAYTFGGIIVAYLYIAIPGLVGEVHVSIIATFVFTAILYGAIAILRRVFKITSNAGVLIVALIGTVFIYYFAWVFHVVFMFFGHNPFTELGNFLSETILLVFRSPEPINDLIYFIRMLNEQGLEIGDNYYYGLLLGVFWVGEFLIIFAAPVIAAFMFDGIFLYSYNTWANPRHFPYTFLRFGPEERERISAGDTDVILYQPMAVSSDFSTIALLYADGARTEYIAVYDASLGKKGSVNHSNPSRAIQLTPERIAELEQKLALKYKEDF